MFDGLMIWNGTVQMKSLLDAAKCTLNAHMLFASYCPAEEDIMEWALHLLSPASSSLEFYFTNSVLLSSALCAHGDL